MGSDQLQNETINKKKLQKQKYVDRSYNKFALENFIPNLYYLSGNRIFTRKHILKKKVNTRKKKTNKNPQNILPNFCTAGR